MQRYFWHLYINVININAKVYGIEHLNYGEKKCYINMKNKKTLKKKTLKKDELYMIIRTVNETV